MATFHPSEFPSCPHEVTTRAIVQAELIAAHDWCRDLDRPGIYAMYRLDRTGDVFAPATYVFCFSDANAALEFKLVFG